MTKSKAVIIGGELAEQHAKTLQGFYDLNKKGVSVGGLFLEQVLDVIRSLKGLTSYIQANAFAMPKKSNVTTVATAALKLIMVNEARFCLAAMSLFTA